MVTTDNQVSRAVVLANDSVPDGFPGTSHSHGKGKERQVGHAVGILRHDGLVHTDTSAQDVRK